MPPNLLHEVLYGALLGRRHAEALQRGGGGGGGGGGQTGDMGEAVKIMLTLIILIIVKLRQGSGKDWQGMAVKVKGLKA